MQKQVYRDFSLLYNLSLLMTVFKPKQVGGNIHLNSRATR